MPKVRIKLRKNIVLGSEKEGLLRDRVLVRLELPPRLRRGCDLRGGVPQLRLEEALKGGADD